MVLIDGYSSVIVDKYISGKLNKVYDTNIGNINKTITKKITDLEKEANLIIQNVFTITTQSIGSKLSKATAFLPLVLKIATSFYDVPYDLSIRKYYAPEKLSITDYIELYRRGVLLEPEIIAICRYLGFDIKTVDNANKLFDKFLSISDYIKLNYRGVIDNKSLTSYATKLGFSDTEIYNLKELFVKYLSLSDYITLNYRGVIDDKTLNTYAIKEGFSELQVNNAKELFKKFLDLTSYIQLKRRDLISESDLNSYATKLGFSDTELQNLDKLTEFFPSPRDLIDFAVREAFEPDEKLFIHNGNAIPTPFIDYSAKVGLSYEWIKRFWHSHWRLLGAERILEGFHRKLITETRALDYLRRLDYTEQDRELLLNMSYNLLTRVDVRRMFLDGIISSKDLFEYYQTLGYSEKDSFNMLTLSKSMRFIDTSDLRKMYLNEYELGLLTISEISTKLRDTGLDSDEISNFLYLSERQTELERISIVKEQIELQFYKGIITFEALIQQLRTLGVSDKELKRIEKFASVFQYQEKTLPTKAELLRFLKKGIIDLETWVMYMRKRGYSTDVMFMYLQDIKE